MGRAAVKVFGVAQTFNSKHGERRYGVAPNMAGDWVRAESRLKNFQAASAVPSGESSPHSYLSAVFGDNDIMLRVIRDKL